MISNKEKLIISIFLLSASVFLIAKDKKIFAQYNLSARLKGKILLQVENNGEAWYINPNNSKRYYLNRPDDAFNIMRGLGIGITNNDLEKIQVAEANFGGADVDNDGLSDSMEDSFGTDRNRADTDGDGYDDRVEILNSHNPLGGGALPIDIEKAKSLAGRILIQVERNGEAWYVNTGNFKRYYLGRPSDAFNLMRNLGLGITNKNLSKIEQYQIDDKYKSENIIKKYTEPASEDPALRQYKDPNGHYTLNYPSGWSIIRFSEAVNSVHLTNARYNFINEGKAVILIDYFTTEDMFNDVSVFRVSDKTAAKTLSDKKEKINNNEAYENSYQHKRAYEKTTTIQISPKEFMRISLVTAKQNNDYYIDIYDKLLNSIEFAENL